MSLSKAALEGVLVKPGHVTEVVFAESEQYAREHSVSLEEALIELAPLAPEEIGQAFAFAYGVPYIRLAETGITAELLNLLPEPMAHAQRVLFFAASPEGARLATASPDDFQIINMIRKRMGVPVEVYYALPSEITAALRGYHGTISEQFETLVTALGDEREELGTDTNEDTDAHAHRAVAFVDRVLELAYTGGASDIHLQPTAAGANIRLRVDGLLETYTKYPRTLHELAVARIRVLARLRTDDPGVPQDGRFTLTSVYPSCDVRVSIAPTTVGENVVLRLLRQDSRKTKLADTGMSTAVMSLVTRAIQKPHGMVLAVGPTGSGKTTTLYTIIQAVNTGEKSIMTIEDPVEYNMEGIQQMQVNEVKGLQFTTGLRTIVRQDPDVIMVGEIRDHDTADIAVNAAMTGHLLLSTLHTNDAATTFPRLLEMGIEAFLVASSVELVIAQRLVRTICRACRVSFTPDEYHTHVLDTAPTLRDALLRLGGARTVQDLTLLHGAGCAACNASGFAGRTGIFEVLPVSDSIRSCIVSHASASSIAAQAYTEGMVPMIEDGASKILAGVTSLEEVLRVTQG